MGSAATAAALLLLVSSAIYASTSATLTSDIPGVEDDDQVLNLLYSEGGPLPTDRDAKKSIREARQRGVNIGSCYRSCRLGQPPRICHYQFEIESYVTMGDACGDCPRNRTACFDPQCITGDGYERAVLSVNRMIPGPSIHVCRGDVIVVDVHNKMADRSTSIHWHGVIQRETPHSDGVPGVTQCPIIPGVTHRYVFKATLGGTHFWHSHDGLQKMDGLLGQLVVRVPPEEDPNRSQYDADFRDHTILVSDWIHDLTDGRLPGLRRRLGPEQHRPDTLLLNGLGSFFDPITGMSTGTPLWSAKVFVGVRHKFRLINGGCLVCPITLTIQNHRFRILASDLHPVRPLTVDAITILAGDRFDFVLVGPNNVSDGDSFWIHVTTPDSCATNRPFQLGVLNYVSRTSSLTLNPANVPISTVPDNGFKPPNGITVNSVGGQCRSNITEICASVLQFLPSSIGSMIPSFSLAPNERPVRVVLPFGFHFYSKSELFQSNTYQRYFRPGVPLAAYINNMSLVMPPSPPLSQLEDISRRDFCPPNNRQPFNPFQIGGGNRRFRECFHVIRVPLNSLVEILIHPQGTPVDLSHPFHLHGYDFQVLRQGLINGTSSNVISNLQDSFFSGTLQAIPDSRSPPLKDTIVVPSFGYAVIRIRANNPGFWLLHCHFAFHLVTGMAVVWQVGEPTDFVPTPIGFPTCGNYIPRLV